MEDDSTAAGLAARPLADLPVTIYGPARIGDLLVTLDTFRGLLNNH